MVRRQPIAFQLISRHLVETSRVDLSTHTAQVYVLPFDTRIYDHLNVGVHFLVLIKILLFPNGITICNIFYSNTHVTWIPDLCFIYTWYTHWCSDWCGQTSLDPGPAVFIRSTDHLASLDLGGICLSKSEISGKPPLNSGILSTQRAIFLVEILALFGLYIFSLWTIFLLLI